MVTEIIDGKSYRLPGSLSPFQKEMYVHLINWKWNKLRITEPGNYNYQGQTIQYDAILPKSTHANYPLIYSKVLKELIELPEKYSFKLHLHFNHMASSQAANVNLFLPVLLSPKVDEIFQQLKPDFKSLAVNELYKGFQIEFWDGSGKEKGLLGDHNPRSGTDADIAIAYINQSNELCLWLIEHKLTESEFTTCGGAKSNNRKAHHNCNCTYPELIKNKENCYYHDIRKTNYWNITEKHQSFFTNHQKYEKCPFKGGMNQLWRNQLLALALEDEKKYKHVYFSVVHHPDNHALDLSINEYKNLTNNNPKFSSFTSDKVVNAAIQVNDTDLNDWIAWYKNLYRIN